MDHIKTLEWYKRELAGVVKRGTLYDYIDNALEWEYSVSARREYKSAKIYLALGGPTIWLDTRGGTLTLAWGGDRESIAVSYEVTDAIDRYMESVYQSY